WLFRPCFGRTPRSPPVFDTRCPHNTERPPQFSVDPDNDPPRVRKRLRLRDNAPAFPGPRPRAIVTTGRLRCKDRSSQFFQTWRPFCPWTETRERPPTI